ncbi:MULTISPECIES: class I adenylate-forming enzyme family protein [Cupriavidus]|uniref:class I adenylate-forming enzyme family protein n=1 Tax=Cupriavidus TaxID=106589 RepID=UPI0015E3FE0C|nr:class I adenylate-forming enzyme family protein [Cupriavidus pinatubonensis]
MKQSILAHRLEQAATTYRDRVALCGKGVELTYTEWLELSRLLAKQLTEAGVGEHEPVMVKCSNHPLDFVAFLAVWLAGGVVAPVHRTTPDPVVSAMQAKADCRLSVDLLADAEPLKELRLSGEVAVSDPGRRRILEDGALIIFTSGSTGLPKAAVLSHAAFSGKLDQNQRLLSIRSDDVAMLVLNNTFSFGIWVSLLTLLAGGRLITQEKFSPAEFVESLAREGVSFLGVVPTMVRATFSALSEEELAKATANLQAVARLRSVVIGGEPLGKDLSQSLRAFIQPAALFDIYGLTETSTCDFVLQPRDSEKHEGTIGQPFPGIEYRVVSAADDEEGPGELQLRSPYVMSGYLGDEELSKAAFEDGWFRTGDLAVRDSGGYVSIVGRLKDVIVRGGNKVTPVEVERALTRCPGIAAALVTGTSDPVMGQRIQALLVPKAGVEIDALLVRAELTKILEKFKHPDACFVGTELPTGRTGKVDRGQLAKWLATQSVAPLSSWQA